VLLPEKPKPKTRQFFRVFYDAVDKCYFKGWSKAELLVWIAISRRAHRQTGECDPSYDDIQKLTGLNREHIHSALTKLQKRGVILIEKLPRKKGGQFNHYTLDNDMVVVPKEN
jgi:hypothetical protein